MWENTIPAIKNIKIGWWIAVVIVIVLLYTHLRSDIGFIVIAFVVAIMYIFSFASENGSKIDCDPLQTIIAWILVITLIFVVLQSLGHPLAGVICGIIALVGMVVTINMIPKTASSATIAIVAILLTIWSLFAMSSVGIYELVAIMAMTIIAITLFCKGQLKEGLLVVALTGVVVKLGGCLVV